MGSGIDGYGSGKTSSVVNSGLGQSEFANIKLQCQQQAAQARINAKAAGQVGALGGKVGDRIDTVFKAFEDAARAGAKKKPANPGKSGKI